MDQKMLLVLLILALISPSYYFTNIADAFKPGTESNKSDWKTLKDRDNLFTIQYPSEWRPGYTGESTKLGPIDIFINSPGYTGEKGTQVTLYQYDARSAFSSANESLETELTGDKQDPTLPGFQMKSPIECVKYTLNGIQACSFIYTYKTGKVLSGAHVVDAVSSDGTEYEAYYFSDSNSFKKNHPIFEEMINSFKTTNDTSLTSDILSGNESVTDLNITNTTSSGNDDFSLN